MYTYEDFFFNLGTPNRLADFLSLADHHLIIAELKEGEHEKKGHIIETNG